jgi:hypothetical protein
MNIQRKAGTGLIATLLLAILISGCGHAHYRGAHEQLDRLVAEDQVIAASNILFLCTDRRDWQCVKDVFAPQVLFDMTSLAGGKPVTMTPAEIAGGWEKGLKDLTAIHHQAGNYQVSVKRNEADLFCYGIAYHYLQNPTDRNTRILVGSYNLHLIRSDAGWKIDRFKFNLKFIDGNKDLEGSAKKGS